MSRRKGKKVGLIYCPDNVIIDEAFFPPYALSVYRGQLEEAGYDVEYIDLSFVVLKNKKWREFNAEINSGEMESICSMISCDKSQDVYRALASDPTLVQLVDAFVHELAKHEIDYYCFSLVHTPLMYGMAIISAVKRSLGGITIAGGRSVNLSLDDMENYFRLCPDLDFLFSYLRCDSLLQLLEALKRKLSVSYPSIPGLAYVKNNELRYNDPWDPTFKKIPLWRHRKPSFKSGDLALYSYGYKEMKKIHQDKSIRWKDFPSMPHKISVIADQFFGGCRNRCIFCPNSGAPITDMMAPRKMARRLVELYDEYGCNYFFLLNSQINPTRAYAEAFCDELIKHKRPIFFSDSGNFRGIDARLMNKMREAGCLLIWWGGEIISDRMLEYLNKDLTVEEIRKGIRMSHEAGIFNCLNLIVGMPYEKAENVAETELFLRENSGFIDAISMNEFRLIAGMIVKYPERYGIRIKMRNGRKVFDEIDGLPWEIRRKRTKEGMVRLYGAINKEFNLFSQRSMNVFYLHAAIGDDKGLIKAAMRRFLPGDADKVPY